MWRKCVEIVKMRANEKLLNVVVLPVLGLPGAHLHIQQTKLMQLTTTCE